MSGGGGGGGGGSGEGVLQSATLVTPPSAPPVPRHGRATGRCSIFTLLLLFVRYKSAFFSPNQIVRIRISTDPKLVELDFLIPPWMFARLMWSVRIQRIRPAHTFVLSTSRLVVIRSVRFPAVNSTNFRFFTGRPDKTDVFLASAATNIVCALKHVRRLIDRAGSTICKA